MRWIVGGLVLAGCGGGLEPCACPSDVTGHAVELGSQCACLPMATPTPDPEPLTTFFVDADAEQGDGSESSPWPIIDWQAVDEALVSGDVHIRFDPTDTWRERVDIHRTDTGPFRVTLFGGVGDERAQVPGMHTGFDFVARHRVTVRGFDITGARDKGIYWVGGDGVVIEDNWLHDNRGTPLLSFEYSARTGLESDGFTVRNNHLWDQTGECLYIGGSEGEDADSHTNVTVENNLIHGCTHWLSSQNDGINIKDRMTGVVVRNNVVIGGDWSIEVASEGVYEGNLTLDSEREGFHVSDGFQRLPSLLFRDNVSIGAGEEGFKLSADVEATGDITVERLTIADAGDRAIGIGGSFDVSAVFRDVVVANSPIAFDGWGQGDITIDGCATTEDVQDHDRLFEGREACDDVAPADLSAPAGPDNVFFTQDDPWLALGGARLLEVEDR